MSSGRRLLATSMLVSAITLTLAEVEKRDQMPSADQFIGLGIAFFFLSAMGDLGAEGFAGGLSMLLLITVLLTRGDDALAYVFGRVEGKRQRKERLREERAEARNIASITNAVTDVINPLSPLQALTP